MFSEEIIRLDMASIAKIVLRDGLDDWPVRTGRSKRGFSTKATRDGFNLENSEDYADVVEERGRYIETWSEGYDFDA